MTETSAQPAPQGGSPRHILLATDLSCRCDRAHDRATALSEGWGAKLYALHVLEGSEPPDLPSWRRAPSYEAQIAKRQIRADLDCRSVDYELILKRGDPAETILREAVERGCELVVTGVARNEAFGRTRLGNTVEWLVRHAPMPVLVVRDRSRRPYTEIVVATDCSEPSRYALECTLRLFPDARITLFHAYHVPFETLIGREANEAECRAAATAECAAFMARVHADGEAPRRVRTLIEYGFPDELIGAYVRDMPVDLVVLGTHGRSGLSGFLVGSTAERLLTSLPCDVLMVRGPTPVPAQPAS